MSSFIDQLGFNFRPPARRIWKVRELVAAVRTHVERQYTDAWVEGEISNFRAPDSGHLYFTLKDGAPAALPPRRRITGAGARPGYGL